MTEESGPPEPLASLMAAEASGYVGLRPLPDKVWVAQLCEYDDYQIRAVGTTPEVVAQSIIKNYDPKRSHNWTMLKDTVGDGWTLTNHTGYETVWGIEPHELLR